MNYLEVKTRRAICPHCNQDSGVCLDRRFDGSTPKNDRMLGVECHQCHHNFDVDWNHDTQTLTLQKANRRNRIPVYVLLSQDLPDNETLYIAVKTDRYDDPDKPFVLDEETFGNMSYFYEEHQCPTNFMRSVAQFVYKDDDDPHGLFKFLGMVDRDKAVYRGQDNEDYNLDVKATWPHVFQADVVDAEPVSEKEPLVLLSGETFSPRPAGEPSESSDMETQMRQASIMAFGLSPSMSVPQSVAGIQKAINELANLSVKDLIQQGQDETKKPN